MKKKYIRPDSQLFVINLAESIANGSGYDDGDNQLSTAGYLYKISSDGTYGYFANNHSFAFDPSIANNSFLLGAAFFSYYGQDGLQSCHV